MTAAGNAERLARIAAAMRRGERVNDDDGKAFAAGIETWLQGECDLETALDLRPARGERDGRTTIALHARDAIMGDVRNRLLSGCSTAEAAKKIHEALVRYRAAAWPREKLLRSFPSRQEGTIRAACWAILKASDEVPSEVHIRRILSCA